MKDYAKALGQRLRAIRNQQGLSLQGVEERSGGRWKAVVVGSYERGDRTISVQKLAELAQFYGIPVPELLPDARRARGGEPATKLVLNLERLAQLPSEQGGPLARYVATIQSQRSEYNGKVMSIRGEDLKPLAIIYDMTPGELTEALINWGVLSPDARPGREVLAERLQAALASQVLLEQAKGALAERTGLHINQAFDLLLDYLRDQDVDPNQLTTELPIERSEPTPAIATARGRAKRG